MLLLLSAFAIVPTAASSEDELTATTKDWIFRAQASLGSQADLELNAQAIQICTNEIHKLVGHRPGSPAKFTWTWIVTDAGPQYSSADRNGVVTLAHSDFRLVPDDVRAFREAVVGNGICYGPHEVTHVLTSDGWGTRWATEGLAELTDYLFRDADWRCCAAPRARDFSCGETGYQDGPEVHPYADLGDFVTSSEMYNTAACFWLEVLQRGGLPAIRRALASIRADYPRTTGDLIVRNVNPAVGEDLRPLARRFGFDDAELTARPRPLAPVSPACRAGTTVDGDVRVGTIGNDTLHGTGGNDYICGLAGNDRIVGGAGTDVLQGGPGADMVLARDRHHDVVYCGAGRDRVVADRIDRVSRSCEKVKRYRRWRRRPGRNSEERSQFTVKVPLIPSSKHLPVNESCPKVARTTVAVELVAGIETGRCARRVRGERRLSRCRVGLSEDEVAAVCGQSDAPQPEEDPSGRAPLPYRRNAVCGHVAEEGKDDEDPLPAGDAVSPGVPEDDVEKRRQR